VTRFELDLVAEQAIGELACAEHPTESLNLAEGTAGELDRNSDLDVQAQADLQFGGGAHDQEVRGNAQGFAGIFAGGSTNAKAEGNASLTELGQVIGQKSHRRRLPTGSTGGL
jgi:hypothetical protein